MRRYIRTMRRLCAAGLCAAMLLLCAAPAMAETFSAIVTARSMTVYGEASLSRKLGTLKKNEVVRVTGYSTTIAKISYEGHIGYAKISDMKPVEAVAKKAVLGADASVYQAPLADSVSVTAPAGTRLYLLAQSGEWAMVERDGVVGYVKGEVLQSVDDDWNAPAATAGAQGADVQDSGITVRTWSAVTVSDTKCYKSANVKSKLLGTLKPGIQLTVLATSADGWAYVELKGKHAYCRLDSLKEGTAEDSAATPSVSPAASERAVVSAGTLAVYQSADKDSKKLGTLKQGQQVNVVGWSGDWAHIELDGNYGYCALSGLTREGAAPSATYSPNLANAKKGTVTAESLPVYQTAGTSGKKLGTLKKGQTVNVIESKNGWAYIELNGHTGFCASKGLRIASADDGVPAGFRKADFTATVVAQDARVYASTSTNSENAAAKLGAELRVCAYNDTWACVVSGGSYGFIPVKQLSKAEYAPISGDGEALRTLLKALLCGGYYDADPSASYNAAAIAAIKRFQSACGLEETGVADQTMQRILYSGSAPSSGLLFKTFASGEKGDAVSRLQARLYALGYLTKTGSLDGEYGSTTTAAVKLFQSASGIDATGTADPVTLKALYSTEAKRLPSGSKAADAAASSGSSSGSSSTYLNSVPNGLASTTSSYSSGMSNAEKLEYAVYLCQGRLGDPYVYGATGPTKFDCSGLTTWAFKAIGVSLKRSAYAQGYDESFPKIEGADNLRRGDIVFFNTISDSDLSDHAGLYIGDGYFIHASSGAHKVVVSNLTTGFYGRVFSWGRRILN